MKRGFLTAFVVIVLSIGALVVGYMYKYPNYTYRYRLTVNIEVDGKVHSGSSVIEVTWHGGPEIGDVGPYTPTIRGQAPLVDLGVRGIVVAALINGEGYGRPSSGSAWGVLWIAPRAFGRESSVDELPDLPKLRGKRELASDNLPLLLWFSSPQDPNTAKKILVEDIPDIFGPSARFVGASVEIAGDPILIDINQKLPWFQSWSDDYRARGPIYLPNKTGLSRYMFVGDAS